MCAEPRPLIVAVEDEAELLKIITEQLEGAGMNVQAYNRCAPALRFLQHNFANLLLLDLTLPDGPGEEVLALLRRRGSTVPVIVLTARGRVEDKVRGLDLGAHDYITKPFAFSELVARIRAAVRSSSQVTGNELEIGDLRLDLLSKVAWRAGRRIDLAPREWALLELFMRNPTQVLSRARILSHVWDFSFDPGSNVVDVYVGYLRRKINHEGLEPMILTVRGAGYRLTNP